MYAQVLRRSVLISVKTLDQRLLTMLLESREFEAAYTAMPVVSDGQRTRR